MALGHYNDYPDQYRMCGECGWGAPPSAAPGVKCPMCATGKIVLYERQTRLDGEADPRHFAILAETVQDPFLDYQMVGPSVEIDAADFDDVQEAMLHACVESISESDIEYPDRLNGTPVMVAQLKKKRSMSTEDLIEAFDQRFDWYEPPTEA